MDAGLRKTAKRMYEKWIGNKEMFQKTPVYRNLLAPAVAFVLKSKEFSFITRNNSFYLEYEEPDSKRVQIKMGEFGDENFSLSICVLRRENSSCVKKHYDVCGSIIDEELRLKIKMIQNISREVNASFVVEAEEKQVESYFNVDGLEKKRIEHTYISCHPVFTQDRDAIFGTGLETAGVIFGPMMQKTDRSLTVTDYYSPGRLIMPPMMKTRLAVYAEENGDQFFFPYFHDADGWIATEPFVSDVQLRFPFSEVFRIDDVASMKKCDPAAMQEYLSSLKTVFSYLEKDKEGVSKLSLSFDPRKERLN